VRALSGGTRQKLLIALALAGPMALLVLDEPTASLDAEAREAFFRLCQARVGDATLLLSSHRLDEVRRLVDRVIALEGGRIVLDVPVTDPAIAGRSGIGAADLRGPVRALSPVKGRLRA
jgi:ABC-2 type transport system ATP-binding protein